MRSVSAAVRPWRRYSEKATTVYAVVMLTLYPLFTGLSGYMFLHLKKYLLFLAATLLWLLSLAAFRMLRLRREKQRFLVTIPVCCLLAFAVLGSVSTCLSRYAVFFTREIGRYDGMTTYLLYAFILYGAYVYGVNERLCLWAFAGSYTACCAIALLQLLGFNALSLFPGEFTYYSPEVQETGAFLGTLGNVDILSALHCLALPLFFCALLFSEGRKRWLLLIPLLCGSGVLAAAGVASGILALLVTALLLIPAYAAGHIRLRRGRAPKWLFFSGAALLLAALAAFYLLPFRSGTPYELHQVLHGEIDDSFGSHRILIWRKTAEVFLAHPWFGIGPDSLANYLDIHFQRESQALGVVLRTYVDNAHSMYLQLFVSFGILGVLPLSILMTYTMDRAASRLLYSTPVRILFPPLLCYLIQALFNVGTCIVVPLFLILWGTLLHAVQSETEAGTGGQRSRL